MPTRENHSAEEVRPTTTQQVIGLFRGPLAFLIYSGVGIGILWARRPGLGGQLLDLGGNNALALGCALGCSALLLLCRSCTGPAKEDAGNWVEAVLGKDRDELVLQAALSLTLQVLLPLGLLAVVCGCRVELLFTPLRGIWDGAASALGCVAAMVLVRREFDTEELGQPSWRGSLIASPYFLLRAGITEEVLFRGCLQSAAVRQLGAVAGIALAVGIFSLGHVNQVFRLKRIGAIDRVPWGDVLLAMLLKQVPLSLMLALIWHTTGNLWVCIVLHAWIDSWGLGAVFVRAWQKRRV